MAMTIDYKDHDLKSQNPSTEAARFDGLRNCRRGCVTIDSDGLKDATPFKGEGDTGADDPSPSRFS